jgi:hypothetical protein
LLAEKKNEKTKMARSAGGHVGVILSRWLRQLSHT